MADYKIKDGDTLSRLARRFGTTVSELAKFNNITDPDKIYVGDSLRVPEPKLDMSALVKQLLPAMSGGMPGAPAQLPQQLQRPQPQQVQNPNAPQTLPHPGMFNPGQDAIQPVSPEMMGMGVPGMIRGAGGLAAGGLAGLARGMPPQMAKPGRIQPPQGYSNIVPMGNNGAVNSSMAHGVLNSKGGGLPQGSVDMNALLQMIKSRRPR